MLGLGDFLGQGSGIGAHGFGCRGYDFSELSVLASGIEKLDTQGHREALASSTLKRLL